MKTWMAVGAFAAAFYVLYLHYLAYTSLYAAKKTGRLSQAGVLSKVLGYVVFYLGSVLDIAFNWTLFSVVFLEAPTTWTITQRCQRHMNDDGWRGYRARWICRRMLDPFQEGGHC